MFEQMFFHESDVDIKQAVIRRALLLPEEVGLLIANDLIRWDAMEVKKALSVIQVPILTIQSTSDSDGQRRSVKQGERTSWLNLLSYHLDQQQLEIEIIPETGHFAMLEHPAEVNRLLDEFLFSNKSF